MAKAIWRYSRVGFHHCSPVRMMIEVLPEGVATAEENAAARERYRQLLTDADGFAHRFLAVRGTANGIDHD